jgi:hypothetical protein
MTPDYLVVLTGNQGDKGVERIKDSSSNPTYPNSPLLF